MLIDQIGSDPFLKDMDKGFDKYFVRAVVDYAHAQEKRDAALLNARALNDLVKENERIYRQLTWSRLFWFPASFITEILLLPIQFVFAMINGVFACLTLLFVFTIQFVFAMINGVFACLTLLFVFTIVFQTVLRINTEIDTRDMINDFMEMRNFTNTCHYNFLIYKMLQKPILFITSEHYTAALNSSLSDVKTATQQFSSTILNWNGTRWIIQK